MSESVRAVIARSDSDEAIRRFRWKPTVLGQVLMVHGVYRTDRFARDDIELHNKSMKTAPKRIKTDRLVVI